MPLVRIVLALLLLLAPLAARADSPVLSLAMGGTVRRLGAAELLARPDLATVAIPADASYGRAMTYRAVKLRALLDATAAGRYEMPRPPADMRCHGRRPI